MRKDSELVEANSSEEDSEKIVDGAIEYKKVRKAVFKNKSKGKKARNINATDMNYYPDAD